MYGDSGTACTSTGSVGSGGCGLQAIAGDPGFVDAVGGDFHLKPGSPLIDAGIANDPFTGTLDGGPRTLDGNADGIARSDAGYDEYEPTPDTTIDSGPSTALSGLPVSFSFHSSTAGTAFVCAIDGLASVPCDGGRYTSPGLSAGLHSFSVTASFAGHSDPTPATTWFTLSAPSPGQSPPPGGTAVAKLTRLHLSRSRLHAGTVPASATLSLKVSAPALITATLDQQLGKRKSKRIGHSLTLTVKRAGTARLSLKQLSARLKKGRYRIVLHVGNLTVKSATITVS